MVNVPIRLERMRRGVREFRSSSLFAMFTSEVGSETLGDSFHVGDLRLLQVGLRATGTLNNVVTACCLHIF